MPPSPMRSSSRYAPRTRPTIAAEYTREPLTARRASERTADAEADQPGLHRRRHDRRSLVAARAEDVRGDAADDQQAADAVEAEHDRVGAAALLVARIGVRRVVLRQLVVDGP